MKNLFAVAVATLALTTSAFAKGDALSLVPNDSVSVGVIRLADMRTSPLSAMLFQQTDKVSSDGDARKFLTDAGLDPVKDVDVLVVATSPVTALGTDAKVLVAADGRYNVDRLTAALITRGAVKKGNYLTLPQGKDTNNSGAVAFPDSHLALIGTESAVIEALANRAAGGTTFFTSSGLGHDATRVDAHATAYALVDVARAARLTHGAHLPNGPQGATLSAALKNVSTVAIWATDGGDTLKVGAFGLTHDADTLGLLEDTLRGALSALRLAAQDKSPDLVTVLRRFTVVRTDDSVTISGSLPADTLKTYVAKAHQTTR